MNAVPDHAPGLEHAFGFVPEEGQAQINDIEGQVPAGIRGTYYLNGPARFGRGDRRYGHWLDGDGMVIALRFEPQGVTITRRFVRSHKWVEEETQSQSLFRGFGTAFEGDQLLRGILLASPVNVNVQRVGDRLLAFGEQSLPWQLDPDTLETQGEFTFGGRLNAISPFSAHPHLSADGKELFNFGISFASKRPMVNLFRCTIDGEMLYRKRVPIEHPCMAHDFMLGRNHLIFHLSPHLMDMETFARNGGSVMDALSWQPELGSRLLIVDRESGEKLKEATIEANYCLHLIASFERDGKLFLDILELDRPVYDQYQVPDGLFTDARTARPVRYALDLQSLEVLDKTFLGDARMCDFPAIDPRKAEEDYNDFWVLGISDSEVPGRKFFNELVRYNWKTGGAAGVWKAPPKHYLGGEPVFMPDPEQENAGWVICQSFDTENKKSAFLIFDAFRLADGPQAVLKLESPVHLGFHTCFAPD